MSVKMQPGHWRQRDGRTAIVHAVNWHHRWPWKGTDADGDANSWGNDGHCLGRNRPDELDLVEYIGPLFELCEVIE